jgi:L-aminopeptidase/D-esterase-like protein
MSWDESQPLGPIGGGSLTSVAGVTVGHWTDADAGTGCTVIVLPEPNVVAAEVRGAAPGTRETALLAPGMSVQQVDAIVLTGGSAFGLATADGVVAALEADGRGFPTSAGRVPIVPAAAIFDLEPDGGGRRPTTEHGRAAYAAASGETVTTGRVGAGTGAVVARWRDQRLPGGLGSAAVEVGGVTVGALAVVNAMGDIFTLAGEPLTGGPPAPPVLQADLGPGEQTTLVVVATDAALDRTELTRVAVRSQGALAACIRPAHTAFDGDTCFAVSCGERTVAPHDVAEAAFVATAAAIESALAS